MTLPFSIHFDHKVRRRVAAEVDVLQAAHLLFVGKPEAFVRLQPAPQIAATESR